MSDSSDSSSERDPASSGGSDRPAGREERDEAFLANVSNLVKTLTQGVVVTGERVQETIEDAVRRGRMTRKDAHELAAAIVSASRRQTDELRHELELLLERGRTRKGRGAESDAAAPSPVGTADGAASVGEAPASARRRSAASTRAKTASAPPKATGSAKAATTAGSATTAGPAKAGASAKAKAPASAKASAKARTAASTKAKAPAKATASAKTKTEASAKTTGPAKGNTSAKTKTKTPAKTTGPAKGNASAKAKAPARARRSTTGSASAPTSAKASSKVGSGGSAGVPFAGYADLTAAEIGRRLVGLPPADLRAVRAYEAGHGKRKTVLAAVDRRLAG